jgi:hypothetical protein
MDARLSDHSNHIQQQQQQRQRNCCTLQMAASADSK